MNTSSDSEDDCYGNAAKTLENLKKKYQDDNIYRINVFNDSIETPPKINKVNKNSIKTKSDSSNGISCLSDVEKLADIELEKPLASDTNNRVTRCSKRKSNTDLSIPETSLSGNNSRCPPKRRRRGGKNSSKNLPVSSKIETLPVTRRKNSFRACRNNTTITFDDDIPTVIIPDTIDYPGNSEAQTLFSNSVNNDVIIIEDNNSGRRRGGNSRKKLPVSSEIGTLPATRRKNAFRACQNKRKPITDNIIYSVGNTMDYQDNSEEHTLFSNNVNNDVTIRDDTDLLDENEELCLKVYWQSSEIFKFNVRKYQKLTTIFRHFSEKENVSQNQLLFTYNDTILKPDDTPDSINYNIAKFIDGGIIKRPINIRINSDLKNECGGIKIKFQCQNFKKPFETSLQVDDKLALTMMKCAEHFELPLTKLKFEFDGDNINGSMTPKDLDLEGGECIDVKILK